MSSSSNSEPKRNLFDPLFEICLHPRQTIQSLTPAQKRLTIPIACLAGIGEAFDRAANAGIGASEDLVYIISLALVGGSITGLITVYIGALFLLAFGKLFKGKATWRQLSQAFIWARVPVAIGTLLWIPLILVYGRYVFSPEMLEFGSGPPLMMFIGAILIALKIWFFVLLIATITEVQGYSHWWRALASIVLLLLLVMIISIVVSLAGFILKVGGGALGAASGNPIGIQR